MKKSQIAIFVIIGLILVTIVGILVLKNSSITLDSNPDTVLENVEKHVNSCLKKTTVTAIELLGKQGLIYPEIYLASEDLKVSYYYFKGESYFPEKEKLNQEIQRYVKENINDCVDEFSNNKVVLSHEGIPKPNVDISDGSVSVKLDYPLTIFLEGDEDSLNFFEADVSVDLDDIFKIAKEIILDTVQDPEWINFENLYNKAMDVRIIKINQNTIIYIITDNNFGLEGENYEFRFAVKYDF